MDTFNAEYEAKHEAFEKQFWGTKMALKEGTFTAELLSETKKAMEDCLSDTVTLERAKKLLEGAPQVSDDASSSKETQVKKVLECIVRTCECYTMPAEVKSIREGTAQLESKLEMARNQMKLGYIDPTSGEFVATSSVGLRNKLSTATEESLRKAAYEGLRSIGPFVLDNGFVEIVKQRNQLAKSLGFEDYYDYKVTHAEGFSKKRLFEILDSLKDGTTPIMEEARANFVKLYGNDGTKPWNMPYMLKGSIVAKMDPYFPFAKAVERYVRSYAAMKITYEGATMNLDLLDRQNKYSNGFCHWPKVAWQPIGDDESTTFIPSTTNFTSLADPTAVGSGLTALRTLMHEAGHAAHFANIKQPSPLFGQERAPTSVAYAENQSMFLDSLVEDAAWRAKYAKDPKQGNAPIPFELLEEEIRSTHPFNVFPLRAMLAVSYFEKALYELPEDQMTKETIMDLADQVEMEIQGGPGSRPMLSIPHLVSDEASCYYHGYTLAEMSVHQTREYFLNKYGYIVDNPHVGPTLQSAYWECGNSRPFLELVKDLTGKDLTGEAWVDHLKESVENKIIRSKKEYDEALKASSGGEEKEESTEIDLKMTVRFVDGDELIADSSVEGGVLRACAKFEEYVQARVEAASKT